VKHISPELFLPDDGLLPKPRNRWEKRRARLLRWADLLDAHCGPFALFSRIEYISSDGRGALRVADSPVGVAFMDPVLRGQGLEGDSLDDAMRFFDLKIGEAHWALCDCHFAGNERNVTPGMIATRLRKAASKVTLSERAARIWGFFRG
jgi:hypothetical protein